jgi:hypothetical protein
MKALIKSDAFVIFDNEEIKYEQMPQFKRVYYKKWLIENQGKALEVVKQFENGNCEVLCPKCGGIYDVKWSHIERVID